MLSKKHSRIRPEQTFKAFFVILKERCVMEDSRSVQEFQILGGTFGNLELLGGNLSPSKFMVVTALHRINHFTGFTLYVIDTN